MTARQVSFMFYLIVVVKMESVAPFFKFLFFDLLFLPSESASAFFWAVYAFFQSSIAFCTALDFLGFGFDTIVDAPEISKSSGILQETFDLQFRLKYSSNAFPVLDWALCLIKLFSALQPFKMNCSGVSDYEMSLHLNSSFFDSPNAVKTSSVP